MNWVNATLYTYVWFTDEKYGMDLDFPITLDLDGDTTEQLKEEKRDAEKINQYIKNRNIAGHVIKYASYTDENGRFVEIKPE